MKIKELEDELEWRKNQEIQMEKEIEEKRNVITANFPSLELFQQKLCFHTYSIGHIILFLSFVLSSATSLRGASRSMQLALSFFGLRVSTPSWFTGRLWLQRIGYYKLTRKKEHAEDWVWIIDHTVQLGDEKCLVILGVRLGSLPTTGRCLSHEDVEPITLQPVKHSNGDVVYQQLEDAVHKTGVPREIIADHGSDIKAGIDMFCHEHQQSSYLYDIKHKIAALLKRELKDEEAWNEFVKHATQSKQQVQQTSLAPFCPINQRTKARYMNVDRLVKWGLKVLTFFQEAHPRVKEKYDQKKINEKLEWIIKFRDPLLEWQGLMQVVKTIERVVKTEGLYHNCHLNLKEKIRLEVRTERVKKVGQELLDFVEIESLKAKPNERLVGSSEVIESVFGKLKMLEKEQDGSGFTGLILGIPAFVSTLTLEVVKEAIETVPTKKVHEWYKENIGQSLQSKRKEIFSFENISEQKWDYYNSAI
jgi:hypothetical protein